MSPNKITPESLTPTTTDSPLTAAPPRARLPEVLRKSQYRGYQIVQYSECGIFKNSWDDEPLAYVPSWDLAEEWVAKRNRQEKKAAQAKAAPPSKAKPKPA